MTSHAAGYTPNDKKLDHIMNELDDNKDGVIVFKEFLRPTSNKYAEERAIAEAAYMDQVLFELRASCLRCVIRAALSQAFEHMDPDKDEKVSVDEFLATMKSWPAFKDMTVTREQVHAANATSAEPCHAAIGQSFRERATTVKHWACR